MNWGKGIFLSFVLFAAFLAVMVTIMVRQDIGLVSKQYYQDDLAFQQQYERKQNTGLLEVSPDVTIKDNRFIVVNFHTRMYVEDGELKLIRPSSERLDQHFQLRVSSDSVQQFELKPLERGPYRVKMTWTMGGKEYYLEKLIVIG
jgi:hypothetical protein